MYTTVEMPLYKQRRHKIVIMALCRYCRNKHCRNILVLVNPTCLFADTLVELLDPTDSRI